MSDFAPLFSFYATLISVPCLAVISIIFLMKQKTKESLTFTSGILLIAIGALIQIFYPLGSVPIDEVGKTLSPSSPPLIWHIGSAITSFGFIVTVVGFALVTWKVKRNT